jgi:peptide/nickel transport system permease protein
MPAMLRFLARRAALGLAALLVFITVIFFLIEIVIPFDYAYTQSFEQGGFAAAAAAEEMREGLGLDRPVFVRYLEYMGGLATGSLGTGFDGEEVSATITAALPVTLLIFGVAGLLAFLFGTWLGRLVAWHRSKLASGMTTGISILAYTAFPPLLVFALVYFGRDLLRNARRGLGLPTDSLRLWEPYMPQLSQADVFTVVGIGLFVALATAVVARSWAKRQGWRLMSALALPGALLGVGLGIWALGIGQLAMDAVLFRSVGSVFAGPFGGGFTIAEGIPVVAFIGEGQGSPLILALAFLLIAYGEVMFITRTGMAEEMREDYVLTARAKGVTETLVRDRHLGRNAILPAVSRFFMGVPWMLTGLIILEREMAVFGLSTVFFNAVTSVNTPLILGTLIVMGTLGLVIWLGMEILHAFLDPRIRYEVAS